MKVKWKYRIVISFVLLSLFLISACGGNSENTNQHEDNNNDQSQDTVEDVFAPDNGENSTNDHNIDDHIDDDEPSLDDYILQFEHQGDTLYPGDVFQLEVLLQSENGQAAEQTRQLSAADVEWHIDSLEHLDIENIAAINSTGELSIHEAAPIGSQLTVHAVYEQLQADAVFTVKYDLQASLSESVAASGLPVVSNEQSTAVLINKQRSLPEHYRPDDLIEPNVAFSFSEQDEKRLLRREAAEALEVLFEQAKKEEIELRAVSGFRSYQRQRVLFDNYVANHGEEEARRFSAYPGTSEHQTGLAMDVSSPSIQNRLNQSFGETKEGIWLAENAHRFGFIIRYLEDKEEITGYMYEPWHLRYVGVDIAEPVFDQGISLEEYFDQAVPVTTSTD